LSRSAAPSRREGGFPSLKAGGDYFLVPHFGRAPSFAVVEVKGGSYSVVEVLENRYVSHERGRGRG